MNFSLSLPFFSVFRSPCLPPLLCPFLLLSILCPQLLLRPLAHPASIPLQLPVGRGGGGEPEQARPLLARSEPLQLHEGQKAPFLWAKDAPHQVAGLGPLSEGCQSGPACALGQGSAHNTEGRGASCLFLDLCSPTPIRPLGLQSPAGFKGKSVPPRFQLFPIHVNQLPLATGRFPQCLFQSGVGVVPSAPGLFSDNVQGWGGSGQRRGFGRGCCCRGRRRRALPEPQPPTQLHLWPQALSGGGAGPSGPGSLPRAHPPSSTSHCFSQEQVSSGNSLFSYF